METWFKCLFFVTILYGHCFAIDSSYESSGQYQNHHQHTSPASIDEYQISTDDHDYPYEEIQQYLDNNPKLKSYFKHTHYRTFQIEMRGGVPYEEATPLCNIRESKMLFPKKLKNVHNLWKTIINTPDYQQGIETKTCHSEGTTCSKLEGLPLGFESFCSQQYITRNLMVFNDTTTFDLFRFPSCCLCKIKRLNPMYNEN